MARLAVLGLLGSALVASIAPGGRHASATPPGSGSQGYWMATANASVFSFGAAPSRGSLSGTPLAAPIVGMSHTPSGNGYWVVASDGGMFSFGDARFFGSAGGMHLSAPMVGMTPTRSGNGYWLVAADGGVFTFGDAVFHGSATGAGLIAAVVGMAATPSGNGYWLVAADGGVFTFGDAGFYGSAAGINLRGPIVGIAPTPSGHGYSLVATDGGVFTFGDAGFYGSAAPIPLSASVVGMALTPTGHGYWLAAADGGVFSYGDAGFLGSSGGTTLSAPVVAISGWPSPGSTPGPPPALSSDFPMYMHDAGHSSFSPGATSIKPTSSLGLAWTFHVAVTPGRPHPGFASTPVVANHVIFEGSGSGDFYAIDELSGAVLWKQFLGFAREQSCGARGFAATAAVATDPTSGALMVYAASGDGNLYALKAADGSVVWKAPVNVPGAGQTDAFNWSSPVISQGRIFMGLDSNCDARVQGGVLALDQTSGHQLAVWHSVGAGKLGGGVRTSPAVAPDGSLVVVTGGGANGTAPDDAQSVVHLASASLQKLDADQPAAGPDAGFGSSPTVFTATLNSTPTTMVGACNKNGTYYAWRLSALSAGPVWSFHVGLPAASSGGEDCSAGAAWDGTALYVAGNPTTIAGVSYRGSVRKLNPATGAAIWERGLPAAILTSPTIDGAGALAVSSYDLSAPNSAFLVNTADGSFTTVSDAGVKSMPQAVFADNYLLVTGGTLARILAYKSQ